VVVWREVPSPQSIVALMSVRSVLVPAPSVKVARVTVPVLVPAVASGSETALGVRISGASFTRIALLVEPMRPILLLSWTVTVTV
jgi:hypothetical protein